MCFELRHIRIRSRNFYFAVGKGHTGIQLRVLERKIIQQIFLSLKFLQQFTSARVMLYIMLLQSKIVKKIGSIVGCF